MNMTVNTRSVILDALIEILEKNSFSHIVISEVLKKYQYLDGMDRSFMSRVILGSVERKLTLDYIIDTYSKVKTGKQKPVIRNILRMSVYQLIYMDGVKEFAVCNEAVKLAVKRGFATLKGFVNGVLRTVVRQKSELTALISKADLDIQYSTPKWIVDRWIADYGRERTEQILKSQFTERRLMINCNFKKCSREELLETLKKDNVKVNEVEGVDEALEISDFDYLERLAAFNKGMFFVQDLSSIIAGNLFEPKDSYVIDLCAAPGGKSLHMAKRLTKKGFVDAGDVSERKVLLIRENIERLGLDNIKATVRDATVFSRELENKADIVIADVPCSGLGILNKKPDIKYHADSNNIKELVKLQRSILSIAAGYLKNGGRLIFSTCTINREENENNVEWLVGAYPFEIIDCRANLPDRFKHFADEKGRIQILPGEHDNYDGFFVTVLQKKG